MSLSVMQVDVVSLTESIFSGTARMVRVPGIQGELGIYPKHARLLTKLMPGPAHILLPDGQEEIIFISGGFLEVQPDKVTILAEMVVRAADVDERAAILARENAQRQLNSHKQDIDYALARTELLRAAALLQTIKAYRAHLKQY